jgi:hypothetical protein
VVRLSLPSDRPYSAHLRADRVVGSAQGRILAGQPPELCPLRDARRLLQQPMQMREQLARVLDFKDEAFQILVFSVQSIPLAQFGERRRAKGGRVTANSKKRIYKN